MHSFLGVPIRIRDQVFGNLYLAEKQGAASSPRTTRRSSSRWPPRPASRSRTPGLYDVAHRRERWLAAAAEITAVLLGNVRRTDALTLIARRAREVAEAELVLVLLYDEDAGQFTVEVVEAADDAAAGPGRRGPAGHRDRRSPAPVTRRRHRGGRDLAKAAPWPVPVPAGPAVVAPLAAGDTLHGVLIVAPQREPWASRRTRTLPLLASFAGQAALALERARAQEERELLVVLEDRERIARDLHDVVIQRLFATGMQLQSAVPLAARPEVAQRINAAVDDLDATIRDIRRAIFELRTPLSAALRTELRDAGRRRRAARSASDPRWRCPGRSTAPCPTACARISSPCCGRPCPTRSGTRRRARSAWPCTSAAAG